MEEKILNKEEAISSLQQCVEICNNQRLILLNLITNNDYETSTLVNIEEDLNTILNIFDYAIEKIKQLQ